VTYLILTDGNRGSSDPAMTAERLAQIRHAEQRAAALKLGVKDVFFLGYDDGSLQPTLDLRRQITRWIRRCKPDVVVAPAGGLASDTSTIPITGRPARPPWMPSSPARTRGWSFRNCSRKGSSLTR
jgi:hypothetical protein